MRRAVEDDDALARARTRTIRIAIAVWVPLLLAGVGVAAWVLDPFEWQTGCAPSASAVDDAAGPGWDGLSDAPVATVRASAVAWTDDEMIVLGGNAGVGREVCPVRDGAAYDPTTGSWRTLSTPPFDPLYQVQAQWTGDELFVVGQPCSSQATPEDSVPGCRPGGLAAAGYDPDRDRWRKIDIDADVSDGLDDDAVLYIVGWDGDEVILRGPDRLVAFSPAGDRWRRLPDVPPQFRDGLYTDTWRVHGPTDAPGSWQPIWTGDALVYPATDADGDTTLIAVPMPA